MKIIIARHGETKENVLNVFQGHSEGTLSDEGLNQAKKLGERLKDDKIDAIFSSDLSRASNTAKEIAKHHDAPFNTDTRLRERDFGDKTGKTRPEGGSFNVEWSEVRNAESDEDYFARVKEFVDEVYEKYSEGTVLFVTHGGTIRELFKAIGKNDPVMMKEFLVHHNTGISILEFTEDEDHKIHLVNCTEHLD